MNNRVIIASILILFFMLETVAQAASISTRVRILEGKVGSQDRVVKQLSNKQAQQSDEFQVGMQRIKLLETQVKKLDKQLSHNDKQKALSQDKRYSYP